MIDIWNNRIRSIFVFKLIFVWVSIILKTHGKCITQSNRDDCEFFKAVHSNYVYNIYHV